MDGDGVELISLANSQTRFDLDGNGFAQRTGWVSGDDAFLALDRNGALLPRVLRSPAFVPPVRHGNINDIDELFGNVTNDGSREQVDDMCYAVAA